ncbi:MAG: DUF692 family protein [Planctomycetes bacterium]|nr:DUF692 family protein [Planctomycetota bacterium]
MDVRVGLAWMPEPEFTAAVLPLLAAGEVGALEWSFDTLPDGHDEDPALTGLLDAFAAQERLYLHGVTFNTFGGRLDARSRRWLERLRSACARRRVRHVSEHFGFLRAGGWRDGPPLPVPTDACALDLGRERLRLLRDAACCPVGIENLAFAFARDEARRQGAFLDDLLAPVDGFLLLDLHNLHCQAANFGMDPEELLASYPLHRVREIHVSGGSWREGSHGPVRRDTHDGTVPSAVLDLLAIALPHCPRLEVVILERLGASLPDRAAQLAFASEYRGLAARIAEARVH